MAEAHAFISTLVKALHVADEAGSAEAADMLQRCVAALSAAATTEGTWARVTTQYAEGVAGPLKGVTSATVATAASKALSALSPPEGGGTSVAPDTATARRLLYRAARSLVKPGELADPVGASFWASNFPSPASRPTSFAVFVEKLLSWMQSTGTAAAADDDATDIKQVVAALSLVRSCQRPLRLALAGNATEIGPMQIQDAIEASPTYDFRETMLAQLRDAARRAVPLDDAFATLVDGCADQLSDADRVRHALQDMQLTLHEACKWPTARLEAQMLQWTLPADDAAVVALRVFQTARRRMPYTVKSRSRLEQATEAIAELDAVVDLRGCGLDAKTARPVVDELRRKGKARQVTLAGNNLHAAGVAQIVALMKDLPDLESLDLSGNVLLPDGVRQVLTAAQACPRLVHLNLSGCHTGPAAGAEVVSLLAHTRLQRFYFDGNDLGSEGAAAFAEGLSGGAVPRLWDLSLAGNRIGNDGATALAASLSQSSVSHLVLRANLIGDEGAAALLAATSRVRLLDMVGNPITAQVGDAVLDALRGTTTAHDSAELTVVKLPASVRDGGVATLAAEITALSDRNAALRAQRVKEVLTTPLARWTCDDVCFWASHVLQRPDLAVVLERSKLSGTALASLTIRGCAREGLEHEQDQRDILDAVGLIAQV